MRQIRYLQQLIGDYTGFFTNRLRRLSELRLDVSEYPVSHLAVRVDTWEQYLGLRDAIERICKANVENVWSGRPISKLLLAEPVPLGPKHVLDLIELIPPVHGPGYPMGMEHVGFVVGAEFADFQRRYADVLTGQQDQGPTNRPLFVRFDDARSVKFHRFSLHDVVVSEGHPFDGFHHAEGSEDAGCT